MFKQFSAAVLALSACAAHAGLLGDEVQSHWIAGSYHDADTFVVGAGVELDGEFSIRSSLDVRDDGLRVFDFGAPGASIGSGVVWLFEDLDVGGTIAGVDVAQSGTGWSDSFVTFGADWIRVEFAVDVYYFSPSQFVDITITTAPVPEPATSALAAAGLALLGATRARRARHGA